jgi:tRNA 2-selenouridine synthase
MIEKIGPKHFIQLSDHHPVIDVRSPSEFRQGHIPGAFLVSLYSDEERAMVGTLYHQTGQDEALIKGLDISLNKMEEYLTSVAGFRHSQIIMLYCWRGGLRSAAMAEVFSSAGFDVVILEGGYKAYRNFTLNNFKPSENITILGGYTGSGKTSVLRKMQMMGEQVIDLEALACHKGSVFGALGQSPQPTNEQFENELFDQWRKLDPERPVWIEDESRMIGNVTLPEQFYKAIVTAPIVVLDVNPETRIKNLVREYAGFDRDLLRDALRKLRQRLGSELLNHALIALEASDFYKVAEITLCYYDKAYRHALSERQSLQFPFLLSSRDDTENARLLAGLIQTLRL